MSLEVGSSAATNWIRAFLFKGENPPGAVMRVCENGSTISWATDQPHILVMLRRTMERAAVAHKTRAVASFIWSLRTLPGWQSMSSGGKFRNDRSGTRTLSLAREPTSWEPAPRGLRVVFARDDIR